MDTISSLNERNLPTDLDAAVLACLEAKSAIVPREIGRNLGLSESAATPLICLLALAGKVRICLVEQAGVRAAEVHAV